VISGIYVIYSLASGKIYVGSTKNFTQRFAWHRMKLTGNDHVNNHLQSAWNLYGRDQFVFHILEECSEDVLVRREQWWINKFKSNQREFGYNKTNAVRQESPAPEISETHKAYWAALSDEERASRHAYKRTDEGRALLKQNADALWAKPEYRELMTTKVSATMTELCSDPAVAAQRAKVSREYWANEDARAQAGERSAIRWAGRTKEERATQTRGFRPRDTTKILLGKSLKEWAVESGLPYGLLLSRFNRGDHTPAVIFARTYRHKPRPNFKI
jgi:group I intron endonuclease